MCIMIPSLEIITASKLIFFILREMVVKKRGWKGVVRKMNKVMGGAGAITPETHLFEEWYFTSEI